MRAGLNSVKLDFGSLEISIVLVNLLETVTRFFGFVNVLKFMARD